VHPLEALTASVLDAVSRETADGAADPAKLLFLLRRYLATDAADVRLALERALAVALAQSLPADDIRLRADWLQVYLEALRISNDDRLQKASADLVGELIAAASVAVGIADVCCAIDACLRALSLDAGFQVASHAIDRLEQVVARAYRPGEGMAAAASCSHGARIDDQIAAAAALLTAYETTARLPYAMLAEELAQTSRRLWWAEADGVLASEGSALLDVNCRAARLLCRLAVLHGDAEYTSAAVIAPAADYRRDAGRILTYFREARSAAYGIALAEYLDLQ